MEYIFKCMLNFGISVPFLIWVGYLQGMLGTSQSSTPPLPAEQVGPTVQDPSLTTGEALDKFSSAAHKVGSINSFGDNLMLSLNQSILKRHI